MSRALCGGCDLCAKCSNAVEYLELENERMSKTDHEFVRQTLRARYAELVQTLERVDDLAHEIRFTIQIVGKNMRETLGEY